MKILLGISWVLILGTAAASAAGRLVIHEWGTLTSLEDESGHPLPGINADDEPVPDFVHEVSPGLLLPPSSMYASKGIPCVHPDVTVRLETPVLYIHAPPGFTGPLDVTVRFLGGWLTEFYPDAKADAPGIDAKRYHVGHITDGTVGTLFWQGLKIGGNPAGPDTSDRVWTSPRNVAANTITTTGKESEKFLFYRGVGCADPILNIARDGTGVLSALPREELANPLPFWLADIRPDGTAAFQFVDSGASSRPFEPGDYNTANVAALRASLETELTRAGLYKDEAEALLNTWQVSYFKNPGLRAFYMWPRRFVDQLLPLTVSPKADITRVMVGRIELVTPAERAVMARIGADDPDSPQLYQGLGRFRDALLLDEQRRRPTQGLDAFLHQARIAFYQP